jgi:flavin reductase
MVGQDEFREAMARLGAAVTIVTSAGPGGRVGFTASAVCSVTDTPPTLLVCINRSNDSHAAFAANGVLCVNTLTASQQALSPVFAGMTGLAPDERFDETSWYELETGSPVLHGAAVAFDCRITQVMTVGTHDVLFCEVDAIRTGSVQEGLIYFGRGYHRVVPPDAV